MSIAGIRNAIGMTMITTSTESFSFRKMGRGPSFRIHLTLEGAPSNVGFFDVRVG
jgi:hypothetical protein